MWKDLIDLLVQQLSTSNCLENGQQLKIKAECRFMCMINKTVRDSTVTKAILLRQVVISSTLNMLRCPQQPHQKWQHRAQSPCSGIAGELHFGELYWEWRAPQCPQIHSSSARFVMFLVLKVRMAKAIRRGEQSCLYWPLVISGALSKV